MGPKCSHISSTVTTRATVWGGWPTQGHKTPSFTQVCSRGKGALTAKCPLTWYCVYCIWSTQIIISASDVIRTRPQCELDLEMTLNISKYEFSAVQRHGSIINRYLPTTLAADCDDRRVFSCSSCDSSCWRWTINSSTRRIRVNVASTCHAQSTTNK